MKITIDMTPQELKDYMTPGPAQTAAISNMTSAFTLAWFESLGRMTQSVWQLPKK